ncbi:transmembrane protein 79 [Latimeria chalumnae]|uniref:transmembrane protein 79 n=1 Tax=Latimeria chalumnae TaxID=7897 RepID=UPI0006D93EA6|nr:PREDICTED: transmembrane protein 79 [Latimeria chalumnae]|eukprot:XP_014351966.1 PREDICTED: transmembrane protein 79 [Latimeria chalumnae]
MSASEPLATSKAIKNLDGKKDLNDVGEKAENDLIHCSNTLEWSGTNPASLCDDDKLNSGKVLANMEPLPAAEEEPSGLEKGESFVADEGVKDRPPAQDENVCQELDKPLKSPSHDGEEDNVMPPSAAQVFVPSIRIVPHSAHNPDAKKSMDLLEMHEMISLENENGIHERQPFLNSSGAQYLAHNYGPTGGDWPDPGDPQRRSGCAKCDCCTGGGLKWIASLMGALIIFPCFLYGAYVFLPFDAPLMTDMGNRLVYTLRCGVFGTFPIVIGVVVYGIARLCSSSVDSFSEKLQEVEIHRHYVTDSIHQFVLYFFNVAVLSTYLPQEFLKLIPLLTGLFAISRLIYWLAFAIGSAFRGFGFGLTFLPMVTMMLCNFYFMFVLEPGKMLVTERDEAAKTETPAPNSKLHFWG